MPAERSLYLVRHAIAHERSERWPDDSARPLTAAGAARMRAIVAGLRTLNPAIDLVATSPYARAASTAALLVRGLSPKPTLLEVDVLEPDHAPADVARAAGSLDATGVALVGHEPGMGELAAWLLGAREPLPFKKGGICRVDTPVWPPAAGRGTLIWFATPKMLRALGRRGR
ncbi:MAG: histidine phosphatase family protein [Acidobacteria bacterium]|nr:histidine phosphatase family protein [Acidobacteriota bacterium]